MPDVLYFNGRYTTTAERVLGVEDRGFQFGDAVYEVLKFVGRRPIFLPEHYARFERCLGDMEIPLPFDLNGFAGVFKGVIERTAFDDGIFYLQVSRGETERAHFWPEDIAPTVVAYSRRFTFPDAAKKERGIRTITVPELRSHLSYIKSVNLLGNAFAKKKAQRAGADEALFVSDGRIAEGASSTFFGVREERLVTAALDESVLPGVVRERVNRLALDAGIALEIGSVTLDDVASLDEAFITSTTQGVMPIVAIDDRMVGKGTRGPLTSMLQAALDHAEEASTRDPRLVPAED